MSLTFNPLLLDGFEYAGGGGASTVVIGTTPVVGSTPFSILIVDAANTVGDVGPLTDGQLLIGATGAEPVPASLTGTANQLIVTGGAGSITLSLPQDIAPTSDVTFDQVTATNVVTNVIDADGVMNIGTVDADIINIGNSSAVVNINGQVNYNTVTDLNVTDQLITLNKGGGVGSASGSGIEFEEGGVITAYLKTSADRNGYIFKAPAQTGIATILPGASGFTIDQGSHNPVTLGTANGLSLATQQLSLDLSSSSTTGALSSADWTTFNSKANSTLNNLTSTQINQSLVPDTAGGYNLGANLFQWNNIYGNFIRRDNSSPAVQLQTGGLNDTSNFTSLNWQNRQLLTGFSTAADWSTRTLKNSSSITTVDWEGQNLSDGTDLSLNWSGRTLANSTGTMLDWSGSEVSFEGKRVTNVDTPTASTDAANKAYVDAAAASLPYGDIPSTTFAADFGQTDQPVVGLVAAPDNLPVAVLAFKAHVMVINTFTAAYTSFDMIATRDLIDNIWHLAYSQSGDSSNITFDIDSTGQVTYTSPVVGGSQFLTMFFRAQAITQS